MNKNILISLSSIPILLTMLICIFMLFPGLGKHNEASEGLKKEENVNKKLVANIEKLKKNKKLTEEINKLKDELKNIEYEIPRKKEQAILLVDLEKFANTSKVNITSLESKRVKVENLEKESKKDPKKKLNRRARQKKEKIKSRIQLESIFYNLKLTGTYPHVINFIDHLENYQRKSNINSIDLLICEDKLNPNLDNPQIKLDIVFENYKFIKNKIPDPKKKDKKRKKKKRKKKK